MQNFLIIIYQKNKNKFTKKKKKLKKKHKKTELSEKINQSLERTLNANGISKIVVM